MKSIKAPAFAKLPGIQHGFFTRQGGISEGIYESLNCGHGSDDNPQHVKQNRHAVAGALGIDPVHLLTTFQVHSADAVLVVDADEADQIRNQKADGLVTNLHSVGLGVLSADCTPVLFADPVARVIGTAHAGWRGALAGVCDATLNDMQTLVATLSNIHVAIGPAIQQKSYEIGKEVFDAFLEVDENAGDYFAPARENHKFMLDLPGFIKSRLTERGIANIECLQHDTYSEEDLFFSYRRATHRSESDYGRQISVICLEQ